MKKGKLIVIDGTDGCGKATQAALLVSLLKKEGYKVKTIDFPRYYDNFFGKLIGECLAGKHGNFLAVDSHIASVLYAADRFESGAIIKKWVEQGYIVVTDRYVSSSQIHQAAKIKNKKERKKFLDWLDQMEYEVFKIPKPDMVMYLDVSVELSQKLMRNKDQAYKKRYLEGSFDQAENDIKHLTDSKKNSRDLIREYGWVQIDCTSRGKMLSREDIAEKIYAKIKPLVKK
ncbi:MAG: dTMP kinase [Candidatus Pacebacteria bacterium]|jgi:dTMP kinase|nr:dTMP kinase [Candidatus Paceibacterota bacterium]